MERAYVRISAVVGMLVAVCLLAPGAASAHRQRVTPGLAQGHAWRQGVVPRRGIRPASGSGSANDLSYGGAIDGVGVTTGPPRVYLVFWGSQWGSQGTSSAGYATFSGDSKGMAPDLQAFFKGLGTGGETWSGVMTQYCQGIATGAQTCPSSSNQHVGYPTGGALAGVWEDNSAAAPSQATAHQLAAEAIAAATHFGDYSSNAQYFIVSPHGTYPDGFDTPSGQFCAWHDYTADSTMDGGGAVASPNGQPPVAFTNMPYVTDAGASCGANFVNAGSAGALDGVTIVGGHEYAETITDTFPAGGWTDSSGYENGDKCAWISSGQGASQNITLSTGTFAVQSTWANDYNGGSGGCEVSHPVIGNGANVTVNAPANQTNTAGDSVSVSATASEGSTPCSTCTFTASGLPANLSISAGGVISGQVTKAGTFTVTVTATDPSGTYGPGSATFTWTVSPGAASTVTVSPASVSLGLGGAQLFTANGTDAYGNAANVSGATWATTVPGGSVLTGPAGSTTFTASSTQTGTGTVTASVGGVSGSANVTVSAVANAIVNGGFETGSLSPWTTSGTTAEKVVSLASYPCHTGNYCAQLGLPTPTNGNSSIVQTFTASSGSSTMYFYYYNVCTDTVRYDWATATLRDVTSGTTYTVLPRTCTRTPAWTKVSHSVTAGHRYTLTLTNRDDDYPGDPTYTLYDDATVQ